MSRPASWMTAVGAQALVEARLTARRGENVLAMVGIPIAAFLVVGLLAPTAELEGILPRTMALAIVASGLVNLGIATAYERGYGVLKRLGGSPLGRPGLVASKLGVVTIIAMLQVGGLLSIAAFLGWRPAAAMSPLALVSTTLVGAATLGSIGLAVAGSLRPEAALVVANVLFLLAMLFGGPLEGLVTLPGTLYDVSRWLPTGALADALASALDGGASPTDVGRAVAILFAWAIAGGLLAVRTFRWE